MTVRQVYYQLVSGQVIENNLGQYQAVSNALVDARKDGSSPGTGLKIASAGRGEVSMWADLRTFYDVCPWLSPGCVADPTRYVEVWLEKDALVRHF